MSEPKFAQCRACKCTCLDTRAGLLNPQAKPLGIYDRDGNLITVTGTSKGHFPHRCPEKKP